MPRRSSGAAVAARQWASGDVTYDAATHTSRLPDGTPVPHVTAILAAARVTTDFEALGDVSPKTERDIAAARARGTAVHADAHAYDDDDLVWDDVHPACRPYVEAWATCRENMRLTPVARERHLFHPLHAYAGIMDGVFRLPDLRHVLVDLKCGDPAAARADLQTASYEEAYKTHDDARPIDARWAIWLQPGKRVPYSVVDYSAWPDRWLHFQKFLACLVVYRLQQERR